MAVFSKIASIVAALNVGVAAYDTAMEPKEQKPKKEGSCAYPKVKWNSLMVRMMQESGDGCKLKGAGILWKLTGQGKYLFKFASSENGKTKIMVKVDKNVENMEIEIQAEPEENANQIWDKHKENIVPYIKKTLKSLVKFQVGQWVQKNFDARPFITWKVAMKECKAKQSKLLETKEDETRFKWQWTLENLWRTKKKPGVPSWSKNDFMSAAEKGHRITSKVAKEFFQQKVEEKVRRYWNVLKLLGLSKNEIRELRLPDLVQLEDYAELINRMEAQFTRVIKQGKWKTLQKMVLHQEEFILEEGCIIRNEGQCVVYGLNRTPHSSDSLTIERFEIDASQWNVNIEIQLSKSFSYRKYGAYKAKFGFLNTVGLGSLWTERTPDKQGKSFDEKICKANGEGYVTVQTSIGEAIRFLLCLRPEAEQTDQHTHQHTDGWVRSRV